MIRGAVEPLQEGCEMTLQAGEHVWIPCEVVQGPFSDERQVWVDAPDGKWVGYVSPHLLRENVLAGKSEIAATIVAADERTVSARLPGQTPHIRCLTCPTSWFRDAAGG